MKKLFITVFLCCLTTISYADHDPLCKPDLYVALEGNDSPSVIPGILKTPTNDDRLLLYGIQITVEWDQLESNTTEGTYTGNGWTRIQDSLNEIAAINTEHQENYNLYVMVHTKSFGTYQVLPDWVRAKDNPKWYIANADGSDEVALYFKNPTQAAITAVYQEIYNRYGTNSAFGGVVIQESGFSRQLELENPTTNPLAMVNYTPELGVSHFADMVIDIADIMVGKKVVAFGTFFSPDRNGIAPDSPKNTLNYRRDLADLLITANRSNLLLGGPDVLPDGGLPNAIYQVHQDVGRTPDILPTGYASQYNGYSHEHKPSTSPATFWTPQELIEWAADDANLGTSFLVFTNYKGIDRPYNVDDFLAYIDTDPHECTTCHPGGKHEQEGEQAP